MSERELSRHDQVLMGLVWSLQASAMQQMGKIQNPVTGEMDRNLEAARSSIDVLEMLKVKCRTDTPEEILRMLDGAVMDLQLNYMDEMKKEQAGADSAGEEPAAEAPEPPEASEGAPDEETSEADG